MKDYLQPVGKAWRITSVAGCTAVSFVCVLVSLVLWGDMIRRNSFEFEGRPLWLGAVAIGLLGWAAGFVAWRLLRRHVTVNGVTVMPVWFIQLFGFILLIGHGFVAYFQGSIWFLAEGIFVWLAMIFVGRHIARRQGK